MWCGITPLMGVFKPEIDRTHTQLLSKHVKHLFPAKAHLNITETSVGANRGLVCINCLRFVLYVFDVIEAIIPATHMSQHPSYHVYISALIQ